MPAIFSPVGIADTVVVAAVDATRRPHEVRTAGVARVRRYILSVRTEVTIIDAEVAIRVDMPRDAVVGASVQRS